MDKTEGEIEIMEERELRTAKQFNIIDKVEKLEKRIIRNQWSNGSRI